MYTQVLTRLSTRMDVTVRGMDATFEHTRMYLLRVTVMRVFNLRVRVQAHTILILISHKLTFQIPYLLPTFSL